MREGENQGEVGVGEEGKREREMGRDAEEDAQNRKEARRCTPPSLSTVLLFTRFCYPLHPFASLSLFPPAGLSDEEVTALIGGAVKTKKKALGGFGSIDALSKGINRPMILIGG